MRTHRFFLSIPITAALLFSGCHSNSNQPNNQATNQNQPANPTAQSSPQQYPNGTAPAPGNTAGAPPPSPSPAAVPQAPPPPAVMELPAGTHIRVRLDQDLGSNTSQAGESFTATVAEDVVVNGTTVIPRGARADGSVVDAKPLGRFKGGALLSIRLDRVHTRWGSYPVETGTIDRAENGKGKRTATMVGGGGGLGAIIGGLAGGGKGAVIGALAGAGAGTAGSAFTGNKPIVLPAETLVSFRLQRPIHITQTGRDSGNPQLQTR